MEYKAIPLEIDSLDIAKGTAIIAHSVFDNIDYAGDVARKGMFLKSWQESKLPNGNYGIYNYYNHNANMAWGSTIGVHESNVKAYTHVKAGSHTMGQDVMKMLDEGIAREASFGYDEVKTNPMTVKGRRIKELKEVIHNETSVLTKLACNPKAGIAAVKKSFDGMSMDIKALTDIEQNFVGKMITSQQASIEQLVNFAKTIDQTSDLYTYVEQWIRSLADSISGFKYQMKYNTKSKLPVDAQTKDFLGKVEKFIRSSSASDPTIKELMRDYNEFQTQLENIDTADTDLITQPSVSETKEEGAQTQKTKDADLAERLFLLTLNF